LPPQTLKPGVRACLCMLSELEWITEAGTALALFRTRNIRFRTKRGCTTVCSE